MTVYDGLGGQEDILYIVSYNTAHYNMISIKQYNELGDQENTIPARDRFPHPLREGRQQGGAAQLL